ncbi:MAG: Sel1-repeat-containing protein YbeT [Catillopecten margaritatus gill symbiont]|uniref:Sel1-repeat-containing protein YbeT n=1 Tax=Catillopecten margaritatus gill symbiont TaxID=3083288 RepID=A0AAU6PGK3_9GAMM
MKEYQEIIELANQNDADGQYELGLMYELGVGVEQDLTQAFNWYQKSANQQQAKAQYNLGIFFALGKGVEKDITQSKHWIRCANKNGYSGASIF